MGSLRFATALGGLVGIIAFFCPLTFHENPTRNADKTEVSAYDLVRPSRIVDRMIADTKYSAAEKQRFRKDVLQSIEGSKEHSDRLYNLVFFVPSALVFFIALLFGTSRRLAAGVIVVLSLAVALSYMLVRAGFGQPSLASIASYRYAATLLAASAVITFVCGLTQLLERRK